MMHSDIVNKQKQFFSSGNTKSIAFRKQKLLNLKQAIIHQKQAILLALKADLSKPEFESYIAETHFILTEINYALKNLGQWTQPQTIKTPLAHFPASSSLNAEPRGVILIMAPWNYPFQLLFTPLIGAIAAGNCAILKPSEHAPASSAVILSLIAATFAPEYIAVIEGNASVAQALLKEQFDYIFFTGSTRVGKLVMQAATHHLTPVTLELGGKNPCIVTNSANIDCAARRIVWGKFFNAGQNCVSPDYLLVSSDVKKSLIEALKKWIQKLYGNNPKNNPDYARIITAQHAERLASLLHNGTIIAGGDFDATNRYFSPTLLDKVQLDSPLMTEEIFGPILPIIEYSNISDAIRFITERPHPLALYIFSSNKSEQTSIIQSTQSGGVCINDTLLQTANPQLPFGGIGASGFGTYHGKKTFETFTYYKAIVKNSCSLDSGIRYAPYTKKHTWLQKVI